MEEVKQNNNCLHCHKKLARLVRLTDDEKGGKIRTKNETRVCTNPECWSYIDIRKVKNWVRI